MAHREKCYLCGAPLDLQTAEIDHVIPESLNDRPQDLERVLHDLGRPPNFEINSFSNWMPVCRPCNRLKSDIVFCPSPKIQLLLERAAECADTAAKIAAETVSRRSISLAIGKLNRAVEEGSLSGEQVAGLAPVIDYVLSRRPPEMIGKPLLLTPLVAILGEREGVRVIRGPFGVGTIPMGSLSSAALCPSCGSIGAWNGVRCVACGEVDD